LQAGQIASRRTPHPRQNFAPGGFSIPHRGQFIAWIIPQASDRRRPRRSSARSSSAICASSVPRSPKIVRHAQSAGRTGFFVGDYEGLAAVGNSFRPFVVQAGAACTRIDTSNVFYCGSNVFSTTVGP
jgi:hypothetical protein